MAGTQAPGRTASPTAITTAIPANVVLTVARASIGADSAEKLTLPVSTGNDIVGLPGYRTLLSCGYLGFVASPGAILVSPIDGVVTIRAEVSERDQLTGNTGGLRIGIAAPSGREVDMYFGAGSTSALTAGTAVTRGQAIGVHSGKEMRAEALGFNTLVIASTAKKVCPASMAKPEEWVGGSPSLLAP